MERSSLLTPWRVLLGLLPLCYAAVLLIELQNTLLWMGVLALLIVVLLLLAASLDIPLIIGCPALTSALLLAACGIMLYEGAPAASAIPVTHSSAELWGVGLLAGIAMIWVVRKVGY
jgi:hypothetical protein